MENVVKKGLTGTGPAPQIGGETELVQETWGDGAPLGLE